VKFQLLFIIMFLIPPVADIVWIKSDIAANFNNSLPQIQFPY